MIQCPRCGSAEYKGDGWGICCKYCEEPLPMGKLNGGISSPPKEKQKPLQKEERAVSDENGELVGFIEVAVGCHTCELPRSLEVCGVTYKR